MSFFSEDFFANLSIELTGAFIGAFVAVALFIRELKASNKREKESQENRENQTLKYFTDIIKSVIRDIERQILAAENLSKQISKNPLAIPLLQQSGVKDLHRIVYTIDQEKIYHSFLSRYGWMPEAITVFRRIYSTLDFFEASYISELDSLNKKVIYNHERQKRYIDIIHSIRDEIQLLTLHPNETDGEFIEVLKVFLDKFKITKPSVNNISFYQTNFVEVLGPQLFIRKEHNKEAAVIYIQLLQAQRLYDEIPKQNLIIAQEIDNWLLKLKQAIKFLKEDTYNLRKDN